MFFSWNSQDHNWQNIHSKKTIILQRSRKTVLKNEKKVSCILAGKKRKKKSACFQLDFKLQPSAPSSFSRIRGECSKLNGVRGQKVSNSYQYSTCFAPLNYTPLHLNVITLPLIILVLIFLCFCIFKCDWYTRCKKNPDSFVRCLAYMTTSYSIISSKRSFIITISQNF